VKWIALLLAFVLLAVHEDACGRGVTVTVDGQVHTVSWKVQPR
jgi:hypothetical protein